MTLPADALWRGDEEESLPDSLPAPAGHAALIRRAAEAVAVPMVVTGAHPYELLFANPACCDLWHAPAIRTVPELAGAMCRQVTDPALVRTAWSELAAGVNPSGSSAKLLLKNGRLYRWKITPLGEGDTIEGALHVFEEVKSSPARLRGRSDLFRLTFEKVGAGMMLVSDEDRLLHVNGALGVLLSQTREELLRRKLGDLVLPEDALHYAHGLEALRAGQEVFHADLRLLRSDGDAVWAHLSVSVVRDTSGQPVYFVGMAEDISHRKRHEAELVRRTQELAALATVDPKTGLYNHRHMQDMLSARLQEARRGGEPLSLLMLDVDHFRQFNEKHGHDAGDLALRCVAAALRDALRENDIPCRFGGEEFAVILAGTGLEEGLAVAERVRRHIQAAPPIAPDADTVTCSIGVATYPEHASTSASLLKAADIALYHAKSSGRNRVTGYVTGGTPRHVLEHLETGLLGASPEAINALVTAIDLRDRYTGAHCQRVARLASTLGRRLECTPEEVELLRLAGSLLDVGKIGLPDTVLTTTDRLTDEEWELVRQHPLWGERLLRNSALPREVLEMVRWHHERLDGSGYPDGLRGKAIPRLARIIQVADVATALRDHRPHRDAWTRQGVVEYLQELAGTKLDPDVVAAYCELDGGVARG